MYEQDKRLSWRSKRVLTTGVGLALFAMTLAVAVHTGQRYARTTPTAAAVAGIDARARLARLDATAPAPRDPDESGQAGATMAVHGASAAGRDGSSDGAAAAHAQKPGLEPAQVHAGNLPLPPAASNVARLAMVGNGGPGYVGGGGFGYSHAGLGGGSAGAASADSGGGASASGRNLSSATGSNAGGNSANDNNAGGNSANDNNAGGNSANDSNAGGNSANDSNAGGNSANDNNAGGNPSGGGGQDPLAFAGSALATLPGALTLLGAGDADESSFGSAAGETAQVEVPEPATLGMLAIGLAGLGLSRRRRRRH